ncbi:MAG: hypothetical protein NTU43_04970 [Bacteroidetes bacterium]|nr:hypothetical protein [Bacteroidota bacterium]
MSRYKFILLIIFSLTLGEAFSQCLLFNEIKSASTQNGFFKAAEYNNNYYMVGAGIDVTDEKQADSYFNAMIVKTDVCGKTLWKKFIGQIGFLDNTLTDIICYEGFIYVLGLTTENSRQSTNFMAKLDLDGNLIWYQTYRTNNNDITCYRMILYNNTFLVYGYHEIFEKFPVTNNMFIMEIDTTGKMIKEHEYLVNNGRTYFGKMFKIRNGFLAFGAGNNGFRYGKDSVVYDTY